MRFLLFICILCSTFSVTTIRVSVAHPPQCAPFLAPAPPGPLLQPPTKAGTLFINEVLPLSNRTWDCSEVGTSKQNHNMWIELYNPQSQAFDLYTIHAALDSGSGTQQGFLPFGAAIAAHGFFVVFPEIGGLFAHTENSLLRLLFNGVVIDQVLVPPALGYDQSYARIPDGGANWRVTSQPTIDATNTPPIVTPTPTRSHTSTKTGTSKQTSTKGSNTTSTTAVTPEQASSGQPAQSNGVQPAWSGLQMPSARGTLSPVATVPADVGPNTTPTAPVTDNNVDVPRKILFSSLAVVIAGVLFLCWRRFKPT